LTGRSRARAGAGRKKTSSKKTSSKKAGRKKAGVERPVRKKSSVRRVPRKKAAPGSKKATPRESERATADTRAQAAAIVERLAAAMPEPRCELDHANAWQLLVATILSAQSTDRTVNRVTPALFARYPTPRALAESEPAEVEALVHSTGFFRNKAKAIRAASRALVEQHSGEVPRTLEALVQLPGVARKTANVVLGVAYRIASGMAVDTHAMRVSGRLGLTAESDPVRIERDLCELVPRDAWIDTTHRLILHGRYLCTSRDPQCAQCPLNELCPSALGPAIDAWPERAQREGRRVRLQGPSEPDEA
jgi:endonuclease III